MNRTGGLTAFQIRHLSELADTRDNSATGEAYWYPRGANEHSTAQLLTRRGLLYAASHNPFAYQLTDGGYAAVRAVEPRASGAAKSGEARR